jgi:hypothetical protein
LWLLLHRAAQTKSESRGAQIAPANQQLINQPAQSQNHETRQDTGAPPTSNAASAKKVPWPTADNSSQQALAPWYTPIEFYGKVIDENSNPVAGVSVHFRWATQTEDTAATTSTTESDTDGLFSLQGKRGRSLDVSVSKQGYYNSRRDKTGFLYALGSDIYSPDSFNPVIFHLQKKNKGEPLIHIGGIGLHTMRDYLLAADGKPTDVSLLTGQLMSVEQGDLQVRFQAGPPLDNFPSRITWSSSVTILAGC